jgi:YHS domain-containing protein
MDDLLYLALWGAAIFLMMRFGCGAHMMGHGHGKKRGSQNPERSPAEPLRWVPPDTDVDPVCGQSIATAEAKPSLHDGTVYYFCSQKCRETFEATPERYASGAGGDGVRQLERSHV